MIDRRPLGSSLELADYGAWVRRQPLLAVPGTPVWTTVQTQPNEGLRRQLMALQPGRPLPAAVSSDQIRLMVYTAISSGSRGLIFLSRSPLSATDPETRQRAMELELLNLELQMIEPWAAAGDLRHHGGNQLPEVTAAVLRLNRARLVLPLWCNPGAQCATSQATADSLALVVPGTPESTLAYEVGLGRLEPLRKTRGTGGIHVTLDDFGLSALVLFAQDPPPSRKCSAGRPPPASGRPSWNVPWPINASATFTALVGQLARHAPRRSSSRSFGTPRRKTWRSATPSWPPVSTRRPRSTRGKRCGRLRLMERAYWQVAAAPLGSTAASPGTAAFTTLPWHWSLMERLPAVAAAPNRLPGGDFERLERMLHSGWRHCQHPSEGIHTAADLVAEAAHRGMSGLRLTARADDPEKPPAIIETPPVWVTTPALPVEPGQLVRIRGWVNIPSPITASVDGLLVIDSLGGDDLAERIDKTAGWREFTLYRAVLQPGA